MGRKVFFYILFTAVISLPQLCADSSADLIQMLNESVTWYHQIAGERELVQTPSDAAFFNDNARIGDEIVRLAFQFARSEVKLAAKRAPGAANGEHDAEHNAEQDQPENPSRYDALRQMSSALDARTQQSQQELDTLRKQLETATGKKRIDIQSAISETQSELQLFEARRDVMHTMVDFVGSTMESGGPKGLSSQIEALGRSVPAALSTAPPASERRETTTPTTTTSAGGKSESSSSASSSSSAASTHTEASAPPTPAVAATGKPEPTGLWGLITNIVSSSRRVQTLDEDIRATNALMQTSRKIQAPLITQLKQMAQQSDTIASQPDAGNRAMLTQEKGELDQITSQFKLLSSSFIPLSKEVTLLDLYNRNLTNWRGSISRQYKSDLKLLLMKLLTLAVVLGIIWGIAEVWRRSIFRYVHETRRRYQMLLLRRIAVWFVIALVFIFSFASELGSVATFAGLLTAGVAVALQNVILSIAGYFFLIGKFGVRVGDRVTISGVSGEVVEIGLVRIHVMELGGTGRDVQPTGRVVGFSNSFVFQPTAGVFKQIPGTNFIWHEIMLTLASDSDYRSVEERMIKAVDTAFAKYHEVLEQQRMQMERSLSSGVTLGPLQPRTTLKLASSGLEVKISFPVDVEQAAEIDDRITREILKELDRDPKLKMVGSDIPTIRQITEAQGAKTV